MRILLVEDEPDVRDYLRRALRHIAPEAEIEAVADGSLALDAFARKPADLVISDFHMPHLDGLKLLQALRDDSNVPVLIISADRSVEHRVRDAGGSGFISKPLALNELRAAVHALLPK
ncbi:MAG: response regulator [Oscillochloris sp.]|nr:response regulator [Oscillochloris sp.]